MFDNPPGHGCRLCSPSKVNCDPGSLSSSPSNKKEPHKTSSCLTKTGKSKIQTSYHHPTCLKLHIQNMPFKTQSNIAFYFHFSLFFSITFLFLVYSLQCWGERRKGVGREGTHPRAIAEAPTYPSASPNTIAMILWMQQRRIISYQSTFFSWLVARALPLNQDQLRCWITALRFPFFCLK